MKKTFYTLLSSITVFSFAHVLAAETIPPPPAGEASIYDRTNTAEGNHFNGHFPLKFSIFGDTAWPEYISVTNICLGLFDSNTPTVEGLDLNFFSARNEELTGLQMSLIYARSGDMKGVQISFWTAAQSASGVEIGFVNNDTNDLTGVQLGIVNLVGELDGAQLGLINKATFVHGLQLGIFNYAERFEGGLQIGLANFIKQDGMLPFMVLINGKF